jgi:CRP-like cAMP-binding protein
MDASTGSVSDRFAESGSVLGLPATMAGNAYSLTAEVRSAAEVVFVRRERVLELLRQQTTLCFEVVEILAQEVAHMRRDAATAFSAVNRAPGSLFENRANRIGVDPVHWRQLRRGS